MGFLQYTVQSHACTHNDMRPQVKNVGQVSHDAKKFIVPCRSSEQHTIDIHC